jgi:hypothetical protein
VTDREYEPNLEDERIVEIDDEADIPAPPPTIDPDERIEEEDDNAEEADV